MQSQSIVLGPFRNQNSSRTKHIRRDMPLPPLLCWCPLPVAIAGVVASLVCHPGRGFAFRFEVVELAVIQQKTALIQLRYTPAATNVISTEATDGFTVRCVVERSLYFGIAVAFASGVGAQGFSPALPKHNGLYPRALHS